MIDHPALPFLKRNEKGKVVSAADAVMLIRDGDTLAINVGAIRATTGDPDGNLTMEKVALTLEALKKNWRRGWSCFFLDPL